MPSIRLKSDNKTKKAVTTYYAEINNLTQLRMFGEGAVSPAFAGLLRACASQFHWTLVEQYALKREGRNLRVDGALVDAFNLVHGYWEAKDSGDDLAKEVQKKLQIGYPRDIAAMNIEHSYYELTGHYAPFDGICLVDTFELAEEPQAGFDFFSAENSERVQRQQAADIFVVIGNPPYNAWQLNEKDNNKNRKYPRLDRRINETYVHDSAATLNNALYDPYVKAFRWASDRIGDEGIVAFVTNNSFIDGLAFDGMRKHLAQAFDTIYVLDLGGNVRKNPKLSGTTHNVFGIQVGVSITILVRKLR